jgi:hypothetical protein
VTPVKPRAAKRIAAHPVLVGRPVGGEAVAAGGHVAGGGAKAGGGLLGEREGRRGQIGDGPARCYRLSQRDHDLRGMLVGQRAVLVDELVAQHDLKLHPVPKPAVHALAVEDAEVSVDLPEPAAP